MDYYEQRFAYEWMVSVACRFAWYPGRSKGKAEYHEESLNPAWRIPIRFAIALTTDSLVWNFERSCNCNSIYCILCFLLSWTTTHRVMPNKSWHAIYDSLVNSRSRWCSTIFVPQMQSQFNGRVATRRPHSTVASAERSSMPQCSRLSPKRLLGSASLTLIVTRAEFAPGGFTLSTSWSRTPWSRTQRERKGLAMAWCEEEFILSAIGSNALSSEDYSF